MSKFVWESPYVGRVPREQPRHRLVCLPFPGAAATAFLPWADLLPAGIELWAIQLPGREGRFLEEPVTKFAELVDEIAAALAAPAGTPFALFGHSGGSVLAFEVARELRRRAAAEPVHLFVSGHAAPDVAFSRPIMTGMSDEEFVRTLRELDGTAPEILANDELMEMMLPVLRADFAWYETYDRPAGEPVTCPVTAFAGTSDALGKVDDVERWRLHTKGSFRLRVAEGGHFFIRDAKVIIEEVATGLGYRT